MIIMGKIKKILLEVYNIPRYASQFNNIPALIEEMEDERICDLIYPRLQEIESEIDLLFFTKIKHCLDLGEANIYFDTLQKIQDVLARLYFKNKISLSDKLQKFVQDCDRLDDSWLREEIFKKIKLSRAE